MTARWRNAAVALLLTASVCPAYADQLEELRNLRDSTISLVNALVDEGVLTRAKADEIIQKARQAGAGSEDPSPAALAVQAPAAAPSHENAPSVVRVPYVPESVKADITDQVKAQVLEQAKSEKWGDPGALPDWIQRITWSGDIRLREEADRFPQSGDAPNASVAELNFFGVNIANSTEADNRLRFRARFGLDATVADTVSVDIRLATGGVGAGSNPGSENQTLGNYASRATVGLDRADLIYKPESWLTLMGGRVGNPFYRSTTLVWANDVSLEGLVGRLDPDLWSGVSTFATVGAFPILQNDPTPLNAAPSKWLYAYQSGFVLPVNEKFDWRFAAAYYDYRNVEGIPNPNIYTTEFSDSAAPYRQTGNTVFDINGLLNTQNGTENYLWGLASKFHVLNVSSSLDYDFINSTHLIFDADWVQNLGFNQNEILQRTGELVDKQIEGWVARLTVGNPDATIKRSWQAWLGYRYVQRDATLDAFTDQDFHLGGTDAKGYFLGARYTFEKNSNVELRWFSATQVDGVERAGEDSFKSNLPLSIDVLQLDVNASF